MKSMKFLALAAVCAILASCGTTTSVPITGRKQHLLVSDQQVLSLSGQQYQDYMKTAKPSTDAVNTAMVKRVGQRLASAVTTYLQRNGMGDEVKNYQWEFNLVQNKQVNAFCMPGGKIVVYEGILPVTKDEASLAIVLGHEIAHAVAKHSAEQLSKAQRAQTGLAIGGAVLSSVAGSELGQLGTQVASYGIQLSQLKYSRDNESEADHMGLIFAAMAGYDPAVAVTFWQRMAQSSTATTASWLSSHPSDAKRVKDIQGWLPEAQQYYKGIKK